METVLSRKEENGVKLYKGQDPHRIFSIDTIPNLIFKMAPGNNKAVEQRFQQMSTSKKICDKFKLELLVIPKASTFELTHASKKYTILAEKKVDINPEESVQEQTYHLHAQSLNETMRQLAVFICQTGFSDMEWRNAPVINNSLDADGNRKVALIDLEEMGSVDIGLFGGMWRRGLIHCINEQQGKIVVDESKKHRSITQNKATEALATRKKEIDANDALEKYYQSPLFVLMCI